MLHDEMLLPCAERQLDVFVLRPEAHTRHATALLIAGSEAAANVWRSWGRRLVEQGIAVVGTAQPGFGRSQGPWDFAGPATRAAFDALLAWTRAQAWVEPDRVAVGGYSSGATNALLLAARDQHIVAAVAAAGVYELGRWLATTQHSLLHTARTAVAGSNDAELAARSPVLVAAQIHCPVRLIHGGQDDVVPVEQAELMAAALEKVGNSPDLEIFPERGHSSLPAAPFVEFLAEWLG